MYTEPTRDSTEDWWGNPIKGYRATRLPGPSIGQTWPCAHCGRTLYKQDGHPTPADCLADYAIYVTELQAELHQLAARLSEDSGRRKRAESDADLFRRIIERWLEDPVIEEED